MLTIHVYLYLFHISQKYKTPVQSSVPESFHELRICWIAIVLPLAVHSNKMQKKGALLHQLFCLFLAIAFSQRASADKSERVASTPVWFPKVKAKHPSGSV